MAFFVVGIYGYMATSIQLWHCFREQLLSLNDSNFRTPKSTRCLVDDKHDELD